MLYFSQLECMGFSDLGLGPDVLRAVEDVGYETPTPIQERSIPFALTGRDILGCAQTGTGKTASFVLPMIETLSSGRARARMPRSLILTPTRELAMQISEDFEVYGKYHKLTQALLIGGVSMVDQTRKLGRGVDVLIATPGRLLDHFGNGRVILSDIKILVIDEADRMLDMGFIPDVERIVGQLPRFRQTLFFCATMPAEIRRLADAFLINPMEIQVAPPASPAETVQQTLVVVPAGDKGEALRTIIGNEDVHNALIFCNRKRDVDILHKSLKKHGFGVAGLHGDMPQSVRLETLEAFRNNEIRILVASDVAARGLDIVGLSHVFNFDVPHHPEDYVHRIGRTGRAGKDGRAFTIAEPSDADLVSAIERLIGKAIPRADIAGMETAALEDSEPKRGRRRRGGRNEAAKKPADPPIQPNRKRDIRAAGETEAKNPARQKAAKADTRPKERKHEKADEPVVGMGAHVPAFMLRPGRQG